MRLYRKHVAVVMPPTGGQDATETTWILTAEGRNHRTSRHRRDVQIVPRFNNVSSKLSTPQQGALLRQTQIVTLLTTTLYRTAILGHHGNLHRRKNTTFPIWMRKIDRYDFDLALADSAC
jgi:hypothetical protein